MNVSVNQAAQLSQTKTHIILDVRTSTECSKGIAKNAQCIELMDIDVQTTLKLSKNNTYYIMCQTGQRSKLAIEKLKVLGFKNLLLIKEGYQMWLREKLPIEIPEVNRDDIRYQRHHQLKGFGKKAQTKLLNAHVLLIGAGGLGSSAALYLSAVGVGQITIVDDDKVELSNLQRQIIHKTSSIDSQKVDSAKSQMLAINPDIKVNAINIRFQSDNAEELINRVDIVIDGSDNLETRYLVNKVCLNYSKPLVYASVYQFETQLSVFDFREKNAACLNCLFPQTKGFEPENCSTQGVLGTVPGVAGILQANEAIKLITGIGETLQNHLLIIDMLDNSQRRIKYSKDNHCLLH